MGVVLVTCRTCSLDHRLEPDACTLVLDPERVNPEGTHLRAACPFGCEPPIVRHLADDEPVVADLRAFGVPVQRVTPDGTPAPPDASRFTWDDVLDASAQLEACDDPMRLILAPWDVVE